MEVAASSIELLNAMISTGNPNSITDAGVGMLCVRTAIQGAFYNVQVNAKSLSDKELAKSGIGDPHFLTADQVVIAVL